MAKRAMITGARHDAFYRKRMREMGVDGVLALHLVENRALFSLVDADKARERDLDERLQWALSDKVMRAEAQARAEAIDFDDLHRMVSKLFITSRTACQLVSGHECDDEAFRLEAERVLGPGTSPEALALVHFALVRADALGLCERCGKTGGKRPKPPEWKAKWLPAWHLADATGLSIPRRGSPAEKILQLRAVKGR